MVGVSEFLQKIAALFDYELALNALLLAIVLAIVSMFIWEFYRSTSKRNLIVLNLRQYNTSEHPGLNKFFAFILYIVEYIVIMPILIVLWFAALSLVMLSIAEQGTSTSEILLISAAVIAAIRILAYFKGEIARELGKLFPFIALSVFLLTLGNLSNAQIIYSQVKEIPSFSDQIFSFIVVIFFVEIILRIIHAIFAKWLGDDEGEEED